MLEIKLHEVIDSESQAWIYEWFGMAHPFTLETLQRYLEENPDEKDVKLQIHCDGGNVLEGLAIYDCLRTSGRNIFCNVEGSCHSMAIVLLLSAPKAQRTANPNAQFLIHEVQGGVTGSTTAVERYAEEMRDLQNRILDIYADRTGAERSVLESAMKEEKMRDANYMLEQGFIGAINEYNTNVKTMNIFDKLKNLISQAEIEEQGAQNANEPAEQSNALAEQVSALTAERDALNAEREQMQSRIAELENARNEQTEQVNTLTEQVNTLTAERDALNNTIAERDALITDLKGQIQSNGVAPTRQQSPNGGEEQSAEQQKQAIRDALNAQKKK